MRPEPTQERTIRRQRHGIEATPLYTTIPRASHEQLKAIAAREGVTLASIASRAIRVYLALLDADNAAEGAA